MEVYKVNEELNKQLKEVSTFTAQFTAEAGNNQNPEVGLGLSRSANLSAGPKLSLPEQIRENCKEESYEMVTKLNSGEDASQGSAVQSPRLLGLVSSLSALMLQIKR